jgi:hypothetical protein
VRYGGLRPSDARRLKSLEDKNRRLKKLLAESMSDVAALQDLLARLSSPAARRQMMELSEGAVEIHLHNTHWNLAGCAGHPAR